MTPTPFALVLINECPMSQADRNAVIRKATEIATEKGRGAIDRWDVADAMDELGIGVERRVEA